jgi:hypothetical protein
MMSTLRWSAILGLAAGLAFLSTVDAQQNTPRIGYVSPAGGRQGTAMVVIVGGRYLDGATNAFVSGLGVKAKVVDTIRALRPGEISAVVTKMKKFEQKKEAAVKEKQGRAPDDPAKPAKPAKNSWTDDEEIMLAALRRKVANFVGGPVTPAIGDNVLVQVTIAPDAEPGQREIRLETAKGLTNPLAFLVGQLPEVSKEPVIHEDVLTGKNTFRNRDEPRLLPPAPPTNITLPAVANGQIVPGGADRYQFQARKGQRLVIAASARELIPYISDAVPGWFQATITLYDAKGHELAYADHFRFHPDPVLFHEVREDGQYVVEIRDSIYRGREDFVYRLTVGEIPYLTGIFPLGGQAGTRTAVELAGWNLPESRVMQDAKEQESGVLPLRVRKETLSSNIVPFAVDTLPEVLEKEPNNQPQNAQPIALPAIVNGRIDPPDEWDVFRLEGRKDAEIVAEVYARRLGSPLDSVLKLTDASGKQLAFNDDHVDKGAGLTTHHADSYLRAKLPADGIYYLHLGDAQHKGGPEYAYRLRVSLSQPDFDLRIVPSSFSVRGGASVPITVYALRRDGFAGEIALELKDAPDGCTLSAPVVAAGEDQVKLTLKIAPAAPGEPVHLSLEGRAKIQGREVSHAAVPAEDMMQAFEYRHLVPAQELKVAMIGRFVAPKAVVRIVSKMPVRIPAGGTAQVKFNIPSRAYSGKLKFDLRRPPEGISIKKVSPSREAVEVVLETDAEKVKPGLKGNLTLMASADKSGKGKDAAPRTPPPVLPAIRFEVVKP